MDKPNIFSCSSEYSDQLYQILFVCLSKSHQLIFEFLNSMDSDKKNLQKIVHKN